MSVYDNLIEAVHEKLPAMYEYMGLRKKLLHLDELHLYDVYVPLVERPEQEIPFEEAKEIVRKGLSVLGEDYISLLDKGFSEGWIDVYENQGKRSGAYSWGAYGTHPYVLLNYSGTLNAVFTLAHEMGHAIHSYYSDATQPYTYAGYRIFVAEVASTCNEALLIHHLMEHAADEKERAYLINYFLDQFKSTLYRQTMFAEFEKMAHQEMAEKGSLSAEGLCEMYYELNRRYFGPEVTVGPGDRDGVVEDSSFLYAVLCLSVCDRIFCGYRDQPENTERGTGYPGEIQGIFKRWLFEGSHRSSENLRRGYDWSRAGDQRAGSF